MWFLTIIPWLSKAFTFLTAASNISSALTFLKKYWRETIIVLLVVGMSITGYSYKWRIASLKGDLAAANINIETLEHNTSEYEAVIETYQYRLEMLVMKNNEMEDDIEYAKGRIADLSTRKPEEIIRIVYSNILPEECNGKFDWMLHEAIRIKDVAK